MRAPCLPSPEVTSQSLNREALQPNLRATRALQLTPGQTVADIGAGAGQLTVALARVDRTVHSTG